MMSCNRLLQPFAVGAAMVLVAASVPAAERPGGAPRQDADKPSVAGADATRTEAAGKKEGAKKQEGDRKQEETRPACMHCGATCGLVALCECKPGTNKTQTTEYDTTCDPLCVPGCSGFAWPWERRPCNGCTKNASGCTDDCSDGCTADCCRAWVRQRKKLVKETRDEEKKVIERKVVWACRGCTVGCTAPARPATNASGWWPAWLRWPQAGP